MKKILAVLFAVLVVVCVNLTAFADMISPGISLFGSRGLLSDAKAAMRFLLTMVIYIALKAGIALLIIAIVKHKNKKGE